MSQKALFLDRDGVINQDTGYVHKKDEFVFNQGIFDLCSVAIANDYKIFVVTNQSGIGRGLYTEEQFLELNDWMISQFRENHISITKVYYCPHHPEHGKGEYKKKCDCRKPNPGMVLKAKEEFNIDLKFSVFLGDKQSDMDAATRAGIGSSFLISNDLAEHCEDIMDRLVVV